MDLDGERLHDALNLLGALLAAKKAEMQDLVVCGGSALIAQKLTSRATHDVDVLARRNWDKEISSAYPLPEPLLEAAKQVAEELNLEPNWLNSAASFHFPDLHRLPASFWTELDTRDFGNHLRVSFVAPVKFFSSSTQL